MEMKILGFDSGRIVQSKAPTACEGAHDKNYEPRSRASWVILEPARTITAPYTRRIFTERSVFAVPEVIVDSHFLVRERSIFEVASFAGIKRSVFAVPDHKMSRVDNALRLGLLTNTGAAIYGAVRSVRSNTISGKSRKRRISSSSSRRNVRYRRGPTQAPTPMPSRTSNLLAPRSRYRNQLGRRPGKYATRRHGTEGNDSNEPDKKFISFKLIAVPWSEDEQLINTRRSKLCNVRGVKINVVFRISTTDQKKPINQVPLTVRWCILNPKTNDGSSLPANPQEFFIQQNPATQQAAQFGNTGRYWNYMNRKINREQYGVLKEGTFVLNMSDNGVQSAGTNINTLRSRHAIKMMNIWVPIRRQIKWDGNNNLTNAEFPMENLHFCWWYTAMGDVNTNPQFGTPSEDGGITCYFRKTTYFTNSAMFR